MTGGNILIEKSKFEMASEDIKNVRDYKRLILQNNKN